MLLCYTMEDDHSCDWTESNTISQELQCCSSNTTDDVQWTLTENANMEDEDRGSAEMYEECVDKNNYFVSRLSPEQYHIQGEVYTKAAVNALLHSKEYLQRYTRCTLCWSIWCENMCTSSCMECGGYAMERPCPICQGRCGQIWKRDVEMSHSNNEAHWEGSCGLPEEQQKQFMINVLMDDGNEELVLDGMEQLST